MSLPFLGDTQGVEQETKKNVLPTEGKLNNVQKFHLRQVMYFTGMQNFFTIYAL